MESTTEKTQADADSDSTSKFDQIMEVAQDLMQKNGYNGFSYSDVAKRVGIKSASIHYHFPAKADLALAVARKYRTDFAAAVNDMSELKSSPLEQLAGFAELFQDTLEALDRVCLCGMLATDAGLIPEDVKAETARFFTDQQDWISATVSDGIANGQVNQVADPDGFAQTFLSALEGAMIMARSMNQPEHLATVSAQMISLLEPTTLAVN